MVCKNIPNEGDTTKTLPNALKGTTSSPLPNKSEESGHPTHMAPLPPFLVATGCYPLQPFPRGRDSHPERIHVPFRLNYLKEMNWDLESFTDDPDWYI
jgi:hypothetical protein